MKSLSKTFVDRAGVELHRAERYRVFVALTMIDLGFVRDLAEPDMREALLEDLAIFVKSRVRACDYVARLDNDCIGLLLPETSRQGAEVALKRITDLMRDEIAKVTEKPIKQIIPAGLASYPDAAGAVTVSQFLQDLQHLSRN